MNWRPLIFCFVILALVVPETARTQEWPTRAVTIVHPFAAGGGADVALRAIARALTEKFGQTFLVENRTGAGGANGSAYVARAAPDGYTLIMTATGPAVLNELLFKSVPYDTDKDFTPIVLVGELPQLIIASPKLGFKTLADLVEFGRKNPGKLKSAMPAPARWGI